MAQFATKTRLPRYLETERVQIEAVAREYASRNITVNAVAPGFIETPMTAALNEAARNAMLEQIPLKRPGTDLDAAYAVAFLASDEAGYITGQVINVNGGMYM